jgi:hypothetical protein
MLNLGVVRPGERQCPRMTLTRMATVRLLLLGSFGLGANTYLGHGVYD